MNFVRLCIVCIGYALFSYYLILNDEITKFIAPSFVWLNYLTGCMLGVFLIANSLGNIEMASYKALAKDILSGIYLIYPIILFFLIKPATITEINVPSVKTLPVGNVSIKQNITVLPTDNDGYVRLNLFELWLLAKNYPDLLTKYKIKTTAEIADITEKSIVLRRIFMTCCVADAMPVEVEATKLTNTLQKGNWIEITGSVILKDIVIIVPDNIVLVNPPKELYITRWSECPPFNP